jgi:hypothetical protein
MVMTHYVFMAKLFSYCPRGFYIKQLSKETDLFILVMKPYAIIILNAT